MPVRRHPEPEEPAQPEPAPPATNYARYGIDGHDRSRPAGQRRLRTATSHLRLTRKRAQQVTSVAVPAGWMPTWADGFNDSSPRTTTAAVGPMPRSPSGYPKAGRMSSSPRATGLTRARRQAHIRLKSRTVRLSQPPDRPGSAGSAGCQAARSRWRARLSTCGIRRIDDPAKSPGGSVCKAVWCQDAAHWTRCGRYRNSISRSPDLLVGPIRTHLPSSSHERGLTSPAVFSTLDALLMSMCRRGRFHRAASGNRVSGGIIAGRTAGGGRKPQHKSSKHGHGEQRKRPTRPGFPGGPVHVGA
jgi:hypothetical protein